MASLQHVIGLLYRADWTRLSLSAGLSFSIDRDLFRRLSHEGWSRWYRTWPAQEQDGRYAGSGALLVGPGGRWRLDRPDPRRAAEGNDGERGWAWRPEGMPGPPPLPVEMSGGYPPPPDLFCPSFLLGGYTLEDLGPVTVGGRDAIAIAATPRRDALGSRPGEWSGNRVEAAVDAELGILLRRAEISRGELLTFTELTDLTMNPPEAAEPAGFAAPPGSHRSESLRENLRETSGGQGGKTTKHIGDLALGGLGALIRYAPHLPGHEEHFQAAMPSPDPAPLGPGEDPPPDDLLYLLYRAGEPHDLDAAARQWHDVAAVAIRMSKRARAAGHDGIGSLLDAVTRGKTVGRLDARLRVSGPDRYRLEFSYRADRAAPKITACDGERRWRVFRERTLTGPAAPLENPLVFLADTCWLLRGRLSGGGAEITYRGRRARQVRVTRVPGGEDLMMLGPLMFFPADAIVDAETGCLLRLLSYAGDRLAFWWELDDISTEPGDPGEFRVHVPPSSRVVEETGNPVADEIAVMPGLTGTAARAAAETVRRAAGAVSAARSFLDDLRADRPPPRPPA